jgi:hypothetical protein
MYALLRPVLFKLPPELAAKPTKLGNVKPITFLGCLAQEAFSRDKNKSLESASSPSNETL